MKTAAAALQFADIGPDDPRLAADIWPVLRGLPPQLTPESLKIIDAEGHPRGLWFTGAYVGGALPWRGRLADCGVNLLRPQTDHR